MSTSLREDDKKSRRTKSRHCWRQINFRNDLFQFYFLLFVFILHLHQAITSICKVQKQNQNKDQTKLKTTSS